jgi:Fur family peroxide stress response transcriptional regulator
MLLEFDELCRRHQLKITPQRTAIFRILTTARNHPTADNVYQEIKTLFPNISFDTVNRTLLTFAEAGMIEVIESNGHCRRFEPNLTAHHHFYCMDCGEITDFFCRDYDELAVPEDISRRFHVTGKRMVIKGLCDKCMQQHAACPDHE